MESEKNPEEEQNREPELPDFEVVGKDPGNTPIEELTEELPSEEVTELTDRLETEMKDDR